MSLTKLSYAMIQGAPVNVLDFGAVGDGVTDDTAAVQAFFDACQNGRGYMPSGIYKITSALNLYPQYCYNIEGAIDKNSADAGTVIYNAGTGVAILINNEPFTTTYDSQIKLSFMTIKGNSGSSHGVFADHAMLFMENVWLTGHGGYGLYLRRAYSSAFKQVVCANNYMYGAALNIANNLIHFDHCIFNGNSLLDGYAGVLLTSDGSALSQNFSVLFSACDFTGNGAGGGITTAIGAQVQQSYGVSFVNCYWEQNKSNNLYIDSTSKDVSITGCYFQNAVNSITGVEGLVYENNFHLTAGAYTTTALIDGGMPTARNPTRMFGNTYSGGATANPTGGVSENIQLWYSSIPTGGTWKRGDIVWNSNFQNGGGNHGWVCINPGTPGDWIALGQVPYVYDNWDDSDATLTPFASYTTNIWQSPLTTNRTVTLSSTGAVSGVKFRIVRKASATGAFTLSVGSGPLKALSAGQWCDVEWDGSTWQLTAFGSL